MKAQDALTQRFIEAIRKSFTPCPLIGPKWFRFHAKANPPYFQFTGTEKLAKALGVKPPSVVKRILPNLAVQSLGYDAEVTADYKINLKLRSKPESL